MLTPTAEHQTTTLSVNASLSTSEIRTRAAALNACSTTSVTGARLVSGTSARILALELVAKEPFAMSSTTFLSALALKDTKETHSPIADLRRRFPSPNATLANHHHVDRTASAEKSQTRLCALACQDIRAAHLDADPSVSSAPSALRTRLASTRNVLILALELVASMQDAKSSTTALFAAAGRDKLEIHSEVVMTFLVSFIISSN